jgi:osmotically inducible protein OsmC
MPVRKAEAIWEGNLLEGVGTMSSTSGTFQIPFTHATRFKEDPGSNPEELIGAAHAGCFSMFLSSLLTNAGYPPDRIHTTAEVLLDKDDIGPKITQIKLISHVKVPGLDAETFSEHASVAREKCPVSRALAGVEIELVAMMV